MKVAFRVDGNKTLGLGHVKRCIVIAKNLKERNVSCFFITKFKETQYFLESKGFDVFIIKNNNELDQINEILKKENSTKLVIDSKKKSIEKLLKNLNSKIKIILIDNTNYWKYADLIILSSLENPNFFYPENSIFGSKYLLHGIEELPKSIKRKNNSILLSMGGSDKYNITKKIIISFSKSNYDFNLVVVLGKFYDDEKNLLKIINNDKRFHIIKSTSSLTSLMQQASIGIVTFGITVYEAAICRLPLFVISHSNENDLAAKSLEKFGWISYVGKYDKIPYDTIPNTVFNLLKNKRKLQTMKQACLQIDGLGPLRVSKHIEKL
jgi:spore coat polysaccharide biosynthesis predicted glycosyltransferase SpsG